MSDYSVQHPNGEVPLPVVPSTVGESGLDISALLRETDHVTLDHGFVNTASCSSSITFIDGEAASFATGLRDRAAGRGVELPGDVVPADLRRTTDSGPVDGVLRLHNQAHDAA